MVLKYLARQVEFMCPAPVLTTPDSEVTVKKAADRPVWGRKLNLSKETSCPYTLARSASLVMSGG